MTLAQALASRSTCAVEPVGAVLTSVDFRKVLAIGYRNNAAGLPNRCDREAGSHEAGSDACGCLHAEENAVINCDAPRSEPKIALVTKMPCRMCAKRLINLGGLQDLYVPATLSTSASDASTIELLGSVGIRVHSVG